MEPFIGQIIIFGGNFAIRGFAMCNGNLMPIMENQALFSLLGTTYGGDGRTTFALPDLRGRTPVHFGDGPGVAPVSLGQSIGANQVQMTIDNLPRHDHLLLASSEGGNSNDPTGKVLANTGLFDNEYRAPGRLVPMHDAAITPAGGNQPLSVMQPSLGLNFQIALTGIFPTRS